MRVKKINVSRYGGGMWDENKPDEKKPDESGGTIQPTRPLGVEIIIIIIIRD